MNQTLVNRVLFPVHEWFKDKRTHAWLRALERSQWFTPDELRELQFARIRRHLEFAYREVPFYTRLLDEHELPPWRVQSLDDFARIPCLTRDVLRRHFTDLQPRRRRGRVQALSTGGSTGAPVKVLVDSVRSAFTDAARLRAHRWFGVDIGVPEIVLWGSPIELAKQDVLRAMRDRLFNSRLLSAFDLSEVALARYVRLLSRDRPKKLYGYASALHLFARYLRRIGWHAEPGWPQVVFTTAEPLYDFQRALIKSVFDCPVAVEYGSRDAGITANECPEGGLHIAAEGMVVEVLPAEPVGTSHSGELVITNLNTFAMPILRYRIGDVGALADAPCACGRGLPLLAAIDGRRTDFLVTPGGKVLHALAVIYVLREVPAIREFQVVQQRLDLVRLFIVPEPGFSIDTRTTIVSRLQQVLDGMSVEIELIETIPRAASGKHRYVISTVADDYLDTVFGRK